MNIDANPTMIQISSRNNFNYLHYSIMYTSSLDTVKYLVGAYPQAIIDTTFDDHMTQLHMIQPMTTMKVVE